MSPLPEPVSGVPLHLVVMGVSGSGKSTVATLLSRELGWEFAEGDEFHPEENVEKMAAGHALMDQDRWPWLEILADWTTERDSRGEPTVLSCSALKRSYRDILRKGGEGTYFVLVHGDKGLLLERMQTREDHFMPPSLLESQLDTLEMLEEDERGVVMDIANPPERIIRMVLAQLDLWTGAPVSKGPGLRD